MNSFQLLKENVQEYFQYMLRFYKSVKINVFIVSGDELLIYLKHELTNYEIQEYININDIDSIAPQMVDKFINGVNQVKRKWGILC